MTSRVSWTCGGQDGSRLAAAVAGVLGAALFGTGGGDDPVASPLAPLVADIDAPRPIDLTALALPVLEDPIPVRGDRPLTTSSPRPRSSFTGAGGGTELAAPAAGGLQQHHARPAIDFVTFLPGIQTAGSNRDSTVNGLPQGMINISLPRPEYDRLVERPPVVAVRDGATRVVVRRGCAALSAIHSSRRRSSGIG